MATSKKAAKLLDAEISRTYAQRCNGIQIPMQEIPKIYIVARAARTAGDDMGNAIAEYVDLIRADRPHAPPVGIVPLGRLLTTEQVACAVSPLEIHRCLLRHVAGDWGTVAAEDAQANVDGLRDGDRIVSSYDTTAGKVWIITEADRATTTVLFPSEY